MTDEVYIFNGSKKLTNEIPLETFEELNRIRQINVVEITGVYDFLNGMVQDSFEYGRNQTNCSKLLDKIHSTEMMKDCPDPGKLIIVDEDFYDGDMDWCFGAHCPTSRGLGYVLVSTARMQDEALAKQIFRHELGHMFGAPSQSRSNTIEFYGLHCKNNLCTMQQKTSPEEALRYSHKIENSKVFPYCGQCIDDIINYLPK